ncbi:BA14K family protein [Rhizobium sp. RU36D]|uniref:BA14K family protein n=1 Tax=Rhizobium sp. RU36D TaxID=1907415 RepID=UPI0009D7ED0E|nr:BA14K family protein [Rhizobium sp. RU36D]SMD18736.1 BA14K-like protein [Rhizobium sp. RU36D]
MTGIRKFIYGCVLSLGSLLPGLGQAAMPIPAVESTSDVIRVVDIQIVCDRTGCYESRRPSRGYDGPPPGYDRGPPPGYYDRPPPGYRDPPPVYRDAPQGYYRPPPPDYDRPPPGYRPPPPPGYYRPPPPPPPPGYYRPRPQPDYDGPRLSRRHVQWCLQRYRSYNPQTNRYLGNDGYFRECRSPY